MNRNDYDALTFDVYGTLIDWEPTILTALRKLAVSLPIDVEDEELLDAFDRARAHYQALSPARHYPKILRSAFAYVCDELGSPIDPQLQSEFGDSVSQWRPFPDSVDAMSQLKETHILGALTNMDDASFAASHRLLGSCFEIVVTAERAGAYKPAMRHFVLGLTDLAARGIPPHRVLHVAQSLRADVRPANLLGQDIVWINRGGRELGRKGFGAELAVPQATFPTMKTFVETFLA